MLATAYTLTRPTPLPFAEAVERVRAELKEEGFGVLCEIDVQAAMREKLGVEGEPYLILGACNPPLAHQALQAEPELGVLLPCNVIVYERQGETRISAIDPERMRRRRRARLRRLTPAVFRRRQLRFSRRGRPRSRRAGGRRVGRGARA